MWVFAHACKASIREQLWSSLLLSLRGLRDGTQVARLTQQTSFPLQEQPQVVSFLSVLTERELALMASSVGFCGGSVDG